MSSKSGQPEEHLPQPKNKSSTNKNDKTSSRNASPGRLPTASERPDSGFDKRKALGVAGKTLDALEQVSELPDLLGPLGLICKALKLAVDTAEGIFKNEDDIKDLLSNLNKQSSYISEKTGPLTDSKFRPPRASVQGLTKSLEEYTIKLGELQGALEGLQHKNKGGIKRLWHKVISVEEDKGKIEGYTRKLNGCFQDLKESMIFFIANQTNEISDRQDDELLDRRLSYVDGTQGNKHSNYLPGTRQLVLDEIMQWASNRDAKPIFALVDRAGTGKSTISMHMTQKWGEKHFLAGRFFFSKPRGITSGEHVATTLAKEMAHHTPFLRKAIIKALKDHPTMSGYKIEKKLDLLIFAPLKELRQENNKALIRVREEMERESFDDMEDIEKWHGIVQETPTIDDLKRAYMEAGKKGEEGKRREEVKASAMAYLKAFEAALNVPPIIVLDALDECSNETHRTQILESFLRYITTFPVDAAPFKLFFTCRPEKDVMPLIDNPPYLQQAQFSLYSKNVPSNQQDIEFYAKSRLQHKLSAVQLSQFAAKADGLFIWAFTAASFICTAGNPAKIFNDLMMSTLKKQPLDDLYNAILHDACQRVGENEEQSLLEVLQLICVAREPLPVSVMDELLGLTNDPVTSVSGAFVAGLGSVISDGSDGKPVQALHPTFIEYLLRSQTLPRFSILKKDAHLLITEGCFGALSTKRLCHDTLNVIRPGAIPPMNNEIEDLHQRIQRKVSPGLRYAAEYIMVHAMDCVGHSSVLQKLRAFFEEKLLFWIELMSYLEKTTALANSLHVLATHMRDTNDLEVKQGYEWCDETLRMIQPFQGAIAESALQVYYSALAFSPCESKISKKYYKAFKASIPRVQRGAWVLRPGSIRLFGHTGSTRCLSFSPDSRVIATGSYDHTVRLWDADSGAAIGEPLSGHTGWIFCLAFSPDGRKIASGSYDGTVCLWDPAIGTAIGQPLSGHTGEINPLVFAPFDRHGIHCLSFSPDSCIIASGSEDHTVQLWNTGTGAAIFQPLFGHTDSVSCLSFSPDGRTIASGPGDHTLRLWDVDTGALIVQPLSGHTGGINCLSFSPDGRKIASGPWDSTMRLWDAETGAAIGLPLLGHTRSIECLEFSPTGHIVASGSWDYTVRLWNTDNGAAIGQPLSGHTGVVSCLSFSPDGHKVASGSQDYIVQVWDVDTGLKIGKPLSGHQGGVNCLSFSPDGHKIASGSDEGDLCLWDTDAGATIDQSPSGHILPVRCLSISPDGCKFASGSIDGTVRLWNADTGAAIGQLVSGHTLVVDCLSFSPDGRKVASGSHDHTVRLWDTDTGAAIGEPLSGHTDWVKSVSFSPDGRKVASGSDDHTVRLWNVDTGASIGQPLSLSYAINSLEFGQLDADLFLNINNLDIYQISDDPPTFIPSTDLSSTSIEFRRLITSPFHHLISFDGPWTIIRSKSYVRFCLPSLCGNTLQEIHQGKIIYGGEDGSVTILDCTHLL